MNILDFFQTVNIVQIGCGGTGSWVVPLVSKLVNNIRLRSAQDFKIFYKLVDNDTVEQRNILRQNFSEWDIGKSKSHSLINRYVYNFKDLTSHTNKIKTKNDFIKLEEHVDSVFNSLTIVLGCIDNNKTRHTIFRSLKCWSKSIDNKKYVYIDSGNLLYSGQIITLLFGFGDFLIERLKDFEPDSADELRKQIKKRKKINFLKMFPLEDPEEVQQSCAFFGDQSQAINSLAATLMFCNLQKILVTSELPPQIINFNSSGYSTFEV
jgi:molybdopterin/thiamine biosynthesis adenylyltransferase